MLFAHSTCFCFLTISYFSFLTHLVFSGIFGHFVFCTFQHIFRISAFLYTVFFPILFMSYLPINTFSISHFLDHFYFILFLTPFLISTFLLISYFLLCVFFTHFVFPAFLAYFILFHLIHIFCFLNHLAFLTLLDISYFPLFNKFCINYFIFLGPPPTFFIFYPLFIFCFNPFIFSIHWHAKHLGYLSKLITLQYWEWLVICIFQYILWTLRARQVTAFSLIMHDGW